MLLAKRPAAAAPPPFVDSPKQVSSAPAFEDRQTIPNVVAVPDSAIPGKASSTGLGSSQGSLDRAGYARLVTHLFHSHSSGVLRLSHGAERLTLYFLNGYPVWAETPRATDLLDWLVREGVLIRAQVQHLFAYTSGPEIRAELLRSKIISVDDLAPLLEGWLAWQVRRTLDAEAGSYDFDITDEFAGMIPVYEVNPIREVWQALREVAVGALEPDLAELAGREVGRTRSFNRLFGYIGTTTELRRLGESLLDPCQLADVRARFPDDESTRCLWLLISAGLLAIADAPASSHARLQAPNRRTPRSPALVRPARPQPPTPDGVRPPRGSGPSLIDGPRHNDTRRYGKGMVDALRKQVPTLQEPPRVIAAADPPGARVGRDYVTRMELDHYAFLDVPRDASTAKIDEAYQELAPRYRLRNLGSEMQPDTRRQAKELLSKLVEAFGELSDPVLRRRYDRALAGATAQGRKPPGSKIKPGSPLPASSDGPLTGYPSAESGELLAEFGPRLGDELVNRWQKARRAIDLGEHRRALSLLEILRTDLPSEPGLLADMAWCRLNLGLPSDRRTQEKALEWLQLGAAFRPGHPDVVEVNARILTHSNSHKAAVRALERLATVRPELSWVTTELARHGEAVDSAGGGDGLFSGLFGRGRK
jgi:hypothetical protein